MKFDTIFEEYLEKRKKFDRAKKETGGAQDTGEGLRAEIDKLKTKIENIQKAQEVELRHAKETASRNANELVQ